MIQLRVTYKQILLTGAAIIGFALGNTNAQFNIKVGYTGSGLGLKQSEKAFEKFNEENTLTKAFDTKKYLQGLDLGLRYRWNNVGIEGGWTNIQSSKIDALGPDYNHNFRLSSSEFYVGLENYIGNFGFGVSVGYNTLRYKKNIIGTKDRNSVIRTSFLTSKIYLLTSVTSGSTAISIKPFYIPKWNTYNLTPFIDDLGVSIDNPNEYFSGFGFSVILYNGRQP